MQRIYVAFIAVIRRKHYQMFTILFAYTITRAKEQQSAIFLLTSFRVFLCLPILYFDLWIPLYFI